MGLVFAREFARQGWAVTALCPPPEPGCGTVIDRLKECAVVVRGVPSFDGRVSRRIIEAFGEEIREARARLVVSIHQQDMKFAAIAAGRLGIRYAVSGQNTFTFSGPRLKQWVAARVLGRLLNWSCSCVVATSERVASEFRQRLKFKGRMDLQPNGVDTAPLVGAATNRARVRAALGCPEEVVVLISVGRITEQKNQSGLVDALGRMGRDPGKGRPWELWIVGGPSNGRQDLAYDQALRSKIHELGLGDRVRFTGWRSDVPDLLGAADVYVQPSLWEGSPLAVVEAMAAGLPVVVADNGGVLPGFENSRHGWVVPAGDVSALALALERVLSLPVVVAAGIGQTGRRLAVEQYDASVVAGRFYRLVTGQGNQAGT